NPGAWERMEQWLLKTLPNRIETLGLALTLLGLAHLAVVTLLPGGYDYVFNVRASGALAYTTFFPATDTLGFPDLTRHDGFLLYKIYELNGQVLDGSLPDPKVRPRLRYQRWAMAGDAASGNFPDLHASIMAFVVSELPEPPLRVELYAAHWVWDHNTFRFPWRGFNRASSLELKPLGTYNGLTRTWTPPPPGESK
ncbi:MAG TPA: hypothetical protein VL359_10070, partial [bacterium]|nr:hypothetical protein [bacterium]